MQNDSKLQGRPYSQLISVPEKKGSILQKKKGKERTLPTLPFRKDKPQIPDSYHFKQILTSQTDDRFRYLLMNGFLKKTVKDGNIIFTELSQIPDVWVCYRRPVQRRQNLQRLSLDSLQLDHMPLLQGEQKLKVLTFQHNNIGKLQNLISLNSLIYLNLLDNKISQIQNLSSVPTLKVLLLPENSISKIKNLQELSRLEVLDLHSNMINKLEGLNYLNNLKTLNLANNMICKIQGLEFQVNLSELNLKHNQIAVVQNLKHLHKLQKVFLSSNKINDVKNLQHELSNCPIKELLIQSNPFQIMPNYSKMLKKFFPFAKSESKQTIQDKQIVNVRSQWSKQLKRLQALQKANAHKKECLKSSMLVSSYAQIIEDNYIIVYGSQFQKVLENRLYHETVDRIRFECICFQQIIDAVVINLLKKFRKLKHLQFKCNFIHSLLQVSKLQIFTSLRSLHIDSVDNPVVQCTYLKQFVIYRFSGIMQFNKQQIRQIDRTRAKSIFHNFDKALQIPQRNFAVQYMRNYASEIPTGKSDKNYVKNRDKIIKEFGQKKAEQLVTQGLQRYKLSLRFSDEFDALVMEMMTS